MKHLAAKHGCVPSNVEHKSPARPRCFPLTAALSRLDLVERPVHTDITGNFEVRDE